MGWLNMNNRVLGKIGEAAAMEYIMSRGMKPLARNYRVSRLGEIDIIAKDGDTLCFIEVKARRGDRYGTPAEAVSYAKRNTITKVAQVYAVRNGVYDMPLRFDVIEVYMGPDCSIKSVEHIKDAF
jgi:putative endonuclease